MDAHHSQRGTLIAARFEADPASVPNARRFVADGLAAWGHHSLLEDATLCVSELAGNAALHSESTYMEVSLCHKGTAVRLAVEDDGGIPASAVAVRGDGPDHAGTPLAPSEGALDDLDRLLAAQPATGRGLAIVSVLARDWGVEALENGKRVWAVLSAEQDAASGTATAITRSLETPGTEADQEPPPGWTLVRFPGCPVNLTLEHEHHLDALIRELQLMQAHDADDASSALADRLGPILRVSGAARHTVRRQAENAAARGESRLDVDVAVPPGCEDDVAELRRAMQDADELCETRQMLSLPSSPEVRGLRAWITEQIVAQAGRGEAPTSWDDWQQRAG